jgi:hypothetical protein
MLIIGCLAQYLSKKVDNGSLAFERCSSDSTVRTACFSESPSERCQMLVLFGLLNGEHIMNSTFFRKPYIFSKSLTVDTLVNEGSHMRFVSYLHAYGGSGGIWIKELECVCMQNKKAKKATHTYRDMYRRFNSTKFAPCAPGGQGHLPCISLHTACL